MLVYRSARTALEPRTALRELERAARRLPAAPAAVHDAWVELLIDAGQLEAAVADALCPDMDHHRSALDVLRDVTVCCGRGERAVRTGAGLDASRGCAVRLLGAITAARSQSLPRSCSVGVAEGYAYYALYPESYGEAARRFAVDVSPARVTCLGVRTIGTSLSAVVVAELESRGCEVQSYTVRPRGHPFDRHLRLTSHLRDLIAERANGHALIVDEGPGLSGSSFIAVVHALGALGFPHDRIVLFPSWSTDGTTLVNDDARDSWHRLTRYTVDFDEIWVSSGGLERLAGGPVRDLSGGRWREALIRRQSRWPAVHPQHEQRKFLAPSRTPLRGDRLLKFVGLGRYGRARLDRAERLAAAGFGTKPLALERGFLQTEFVAGTPLIPRAGGANGGSTPPALIDRVADYLAFVRHEFSTDGSLSFDAVSEMIEVNAREGLGDVPLGARSLATWRSIVDSGQTVALDGRMLAHEWIDCGGRYIKTDGLSHHDDHFWPGCQDAAWDVAAAIIELRLGGRAAHALLERYRRASGDSTIANRLPFWRIAYLASRLGYVSMAAGALGTTPDGARMQRLERRYARALRHALATHGPPRR